jgi:hypothetical protein
MLGLVKFIEQHVLLLPFLNAVVLPKMNKLNRRQIMASKFLKIPLTVYYCRTKYYYQTCPILPTMIVDLRWPLFRPEPMMMSMKFNYLVNLLQQ